MTADIAWLRELEEKSWKDHTPSHYNPRQYGWREDLPVSKADGEKALELLKKHQSKLVFEPGSGVFGFGVSFSVFEIVWATFPGVPTEGKHVITLTSKQLFPNRRGGDQGPTYELFSTFTHTEENKKLRQEIGFKEKLRDWAHYDY